MRIYEMDNEALAEHDLQEALKQSKATLGAATPRLFTTKPLIGGKARKIEEVRERTVRDLPWRKYQAIVGVRCRDWRREVSSRAARATWGTQ